MARQHALSHNLANVSTPAWAELSTHRSVPLEGSGASTRVFALEATAGHLTNWPHHPNRAQPDVAARDNAYFALQALDGTEA